MQGCEELYQAVEKQRLLLVQEVCHIEEVGRIKRSALKSLVQEDHKLFMEVLAKDEETHPLNDIILPLHEIQRSFLNTLLEQKTSAGVQKWCDELASKSNVAQSS